VKNRSPANAITPDAIALKSELFGNHDGDDPHSADISERAHAALLHALCRRRHGKPPKRFWNKQAPPHARCRKNPSARENGNRPRIFDELMKEK